MPCVPGEGKAGTSCLRHLYAELPRPAQDVLTRWQPQAAHRPKSPCSNPSLAQSLDKARLAQMFPLRVGQRCPRGEQRQRKATASLGSQAGLQAAAGWLQWGSPQSSPLPPTHTMGHGGLGADPRPFQDAGSWPVPPGIGHFVLHSACLWSQGDKTLVCNPGKQPAVCGSPGSSGTHRGLGAQAP